MGFPLDATAKRKDNVRVPSTAMQQLPSKVKYLIVGAGVHGLSTGWNLARELKARGVGNGDDILIVDKKGIGAGASGIACGVVRNFYFQAAMNDVMQASVEVWESDPKAFHYNGVGYLALVGDVQAGDIDVIFERQQAQGYRSALISGEQQVFDYMKTIFPDWKARGLVRCLHEKQGGFAWNSASMFGLAGKAEAEGVTIAKGVEVIGYRKAQDDSVVEVSTSAGDIEVEQLVVAVGPWIKGIWEKLELPAKVDISSPDGQLIRDQEMWNYMLLLEGETRVDPKLYVTADGGYPPVIHVDSSEPLVSDKTGSLITDELWGVYWKRDKLGIQGGAVPTPLGSEAKVDPYGHESPYYQPDEDFADMWTSALAHCMERFEGSGKLYHDAPSGGIGAFSVDSFPVFDYMLPNVYVIADSNHGYKMIGVGREVAKVLVGETSHILQPFQFSRFAKGDLLPVSDSPFPWS